MRYDDDELERLLSGGHFSGAQYDRIEAQVMRRVVKTPRFRLARVLPAVAVLAGVGGFALYMSSPGTPTTEESGFTPKGAVVASSRGAVELMCSGEQGRCGLGDTLMFVVDSGVASGYLNARAERVEPSSSEPVTLFPTSEGESPRVEPNRGTTVVPLGVRLASLRGPGLYRVEIWFSSSEAARDASRPPAEGRLEVMLRVVE